MKTLHKRIPGGYTEVYVGDGEYLTYGELKEIINKMDSEKLKDYIQIVPVTEQDSICSVITIDENGEMVISR